MADFRIDFGMEERIVLAEMNGQLRKWWLSISHSC